MKAHWLVVDLRGGRLVTARLDITDQGPAWKPLPIHYQLEPGSGYDDGFEIDLAFYQEPGSISWQITRREALEMLDPAVSKITALFDLPAERLETDRNLIKAVNNLVVQAGKELPGLPLLFLYDRPAAAGMLNQLVTIHRKTRPESQACLLRNEHPLAGFALIPPQAKGLPQEGAVLACRLLDDEGIQDSATFQWSRCQLMPANRASKQPVAFTFRGTRAGLERTGAAVFALLWQAQVDALATRELAHWKKQVAEKEALLEQMNALLARLNLKPDAVKATS